jgi:hypothetical protein
MRVHVSEQSNAAWERERDPHLNGAHLEGETTRVVFPPLRADAREAPPEPCARPRHAVRCGRKEPSNICALPGSERNGRGTRWRTQRGVAVDGAGEAAHGDEGAGAMVHAARARAVHVVASAGRACSPLSVSVSTRTDPRGNPWLGRWEADRAASFPILARDPTDGSGMRALSGLSASSHSPIVRSQGVWCDELANLRFRPVPNAEGCLARKAPYVFL